MLENVLKLISKLFKTYIKIWKINATVFIAFVGIPNTQHYVHF